MNDRQARPRRAVVRARNGPRAAADRPEGIPVRELFAQRHLLAGFTEEMVGHAAPNDALPRRRVAGDGRLAEA